MKRKKLDSDVIAEGEATGHRHRAVGAIVYEREDGVRTFDATRRDIQVVHQEHKPVTVPRKKMASGRVLEYDHFVEEARQIAD